MRANVINDGFVCNGKLIQASYKFDNIAKLEENEHQTVYSAIMTSPLSLPCTIIIDNSSIMIKGINADVIKIHYKGE